MILHARINNAISRFSAVRIDSAVHVFEVLLSSSVLRSSSNLTVSQWTIYDITIC